MRFFRNHRFILFFIVLFAIFLRSLPAWLYPAWGGDLGIYFGIASRILETKSIFVDYDGWGSSYNYFPMLYLISLSVHLITGIDLLTVMTRTAPIIGGLTILIFYLIMMELTRKRKIALLSSALLAVAPFHVYQTSHAAPLTVGHFFMLLCILLFIKCRNNTKFLPLLLFSTLALILSHHLTTYFYLISILGMISWRNFKFKIPKKEIANDLIYLFTASALTFSYWKFVAKPVYYSFMEGGLHLEPWKVVALYFLVIILSIYISSVLRESKKLRELLSKISSRWHHGFSKILFLSIAGFILMEIPFLFFEIPTTWVKLNPTTVILSIPVIVFFSIALAGVPFLSMDKNRSFLQGWLLAVSISLLYSLITVNTTLYPYRHMEYLVVPLSACGAFGVAEIGSKIKTEVPLLKKLIKRLSAEVSVISMVMFVILSNALIAYPAGYSIGHLDERYSNCCFSAIEWLKNNTNDNDTIATDLRLSDFIWAHGMKATFDKTNVTWTCENWTECINELEENEHHGKVTYILIDDVMRNSVVYLNVDLHVKMSNESYNKFSREPFEMVFRNATLDDHGREIHWAEVYRINWSYIEEFKTSS
ncbi:MAG: hypothetical protein J7L20_01455 [Thermoplasmata archaeon]|nr:hypothetical protein [Thermoplasmata archaeon]